MAHYIDKDAVMAEIERKRNHEVQWMQRQGYTDYNMGLRDAYVDILSYIESLEVKEVDLEREVNNWRHKHFHGRRDEEADGEYLERSSQYDLAKHFFELGLKALKGE